MCNWHRRAGKDEIALHHAACASQERVTNLWHMLPEYAQARKAIWDAVNPHSGKRRIDEAFPHAMRKYTREHEMSIGFNNGSTWQVVGSDNFNCYSDDTQVLTDGGWVPFPELTGREMVATLDAGKLVYAKIDRVVRYPFDGEMYSVQNNAMDLLVTPNHRFYVESSKGVRKFKRIDDPTILGDKIPATCGWDGERVESFTLPPVFRPDGGRDWNLAFGMDDWCAFMGIFLSEGSTYAAPRGNYRVHIAQKKPAIRKDIEALLGRMGLRYRYDEKPGVFTISNKQLWQYCRQFGLCHEKFVPPELKALEQRHLRILAEWMVKGDGSVTAGGTLSYASTSRRLIDDFQEIAIKIGWSGNISVRGNAGGLIGGRQVVPRHPLYVFYRRTSRFKYFRDTHESYVSRQPYKGEVWCLTAGSHVIKVRRNGKEAWCGNSLMGTSPGGIVMSEYALGRPAAWGYLSPILMENKGWAVFISTPRGKNHFWSLMNTARDEPDWFSQTLTADQTEVFAKGQLDGELRRLQDMHGDDYGLSLWRQEYFGSFDAAIVGAIWADCVEKAEAEGRVTADVPVERGIPVNTAWDLGYSDDTVIWFYQIVATEIRIIDYYAASGKDLPHYARLLKDKASERGFKYGTHYLPHDARPRALAAGGKSIFQQLGDLDIGRRSILPRLDREEGIQAARATFPKCWFDAKRCAKGIEHLRNYHREWDAERKVFRNAPEHDASSHAADAWRYLSLSWRLAKPEVPDSPLMDKILSRSVNNMTFGALKQKFFGRRAREREGSAWPST